MSWKNSSDRYGSLSIGLHWLMFLLIVAVYACIELREFYPKGSDPREALKTWHFMLGLSVLALVSLRLLLRLLQSSPVISPPPAVWQQRVATVMHWLLYALMFAMPIAGWLILSAAGKPIPFFGLELPALVAQDKDTAGWIKEIHETAGKVGYALIGLHAAAALFHHYVQRDDTLTRMLPGR
ncbi:MAG: cytochrome b [Halioglobus sp.]|nr:cytochrome b [Halioglobus sp.]